MRFFTPDNKPKTQEGFQAVLERLKVKEQWQAQIKVLDRTGILEIFPDSKNLGVRGIDGKEYPVPTMQEITQRLETKRKLVEKKMEQGFTKMIMVPLAYPLDKLGKKYEKIILAHHKAGKLLATKEKPTDPDEKLELDENQPLYVWDEYNGADKNGKLVYFPKSFDSKNHKGKTKTELLSNPDEAWQIILVEDMPNIPREGKGETIKERKQIEANKTPSDYLKMLQTDKAYQGEEGLIPEADLIYAITHLEETNQVTNDYQGKGSLSYQVGAYFPSAGYVPCSSWYRDYRLADLNGYDPSDRSVSYGARVGVRV